MARILAKSNPILEEPTNVDLSLVPPTCKAVITPFYWILLIQ